MRKLSNSTARKHVAFLTDHFQGYFHFRVILLLIIIFGEIRDQAALKGRFRGISSTMEPELPDQGSRKRLFKYLFSKIFQLLLTMHFANHPYRTEDDVIVTVLFTQKRRAQSLL